MQRLTDLNNEALRVSLRGLQPWFEAYSRFFTGAVEAARCGCEIPETTCPPRCACTLEWTVAPGDQRVGYFQLRNTADERVQYGFEASPFRSCRETLEQRPQVEPKGATLPAGGAQSMRVSFSTDETWRAGETYESEILVRGLYERCLCLRVQVSAEAEPCCRLEMGAIPQRIRADDWYRHFQCTEPCFQPVRPNPNDDRKRSQMKESAPPEITSLPQRYAEFWRAEAPVAFQKVTQLSLNYYREVWNVGLHLSQSFYRNLFTVEATPCGPPPEVTAAQELVFEGPIGSAQTHNFLVANTTGATAAIRFELSEFVRDDGEETVRVEAVVAPESFELAPRAERTVACTLPLPDLFRLGHEYHAILRVIGFPHMQVGLRARTEPAAAKKRRPPPGQEARRSLGCGAIPHRQPALCAFSCGTMRRAILFCLLLCLSARGIRADEAATALLRTMEQTYAALSSYTDTSTAHFTNPDGAAGAQVDYRIWFQRPALFRIDAVTKAPGGGTEKPTREVLWANGDSIRTWGTTQPVKSRAKVQLAGSKMFGTYAYHIPSLLESSYGGPRRLHQLDEAAIVGEETIDGVLCQQVHGVWQSDPYDVWIGRDDHLVRKIVALYSGYRMEETHREITVNQPIAKESFEFAPEDDAATPLKKNTPPPLPGERRHR